MDATQFPDRFRARFAVGEGNMALALVNELSGPFSVARCRKPLYGRPTALLDDSFDIRIAAVDYDTSVGWQRAHELVKLPQDVIEIVIDICMIEFEIVDEQGLWSIVHKLGRTHRPRPRSIRHYRISPIG